MKYSMNPKKTKEKQGRVSDGERNGLRRVLDWVRQKIVGGKALGHQLTKALIGKDITINDYLVI